MRRAATTAIALRRGPASLRRYAHTATVPLVDGVTFAPPAPKLFIDGEFVNASDPPLDIVTPRCGGVSEGAPDAPRSTSRYCHRS